MAHDFAKLYETDLGQILVIMDLDSEGRPALITSFTPENFGVCKLALSFEDSDEGWMRAEEAFDRMNEQTAYASVRGTLEKIEALGKEVD